MNRDELVKSASSIAGVPVSEVDHVLKAILESMVLSLAAGDAVTLRRFGVFKVGVRRTRRWKVPGRGMVEAPECYYVRFKPSSRLMDQLRAAAQPDCEEPSDERSPD